MNEDVWTNEFSHSKPVDVLKLPGLSVLRKMRGLKVHFYGNCPEIAAFLKPEMEQPVKKPRSASRKRKASAAIQIERKQPARAAKGAKMVRN
jgi:hypothetical protein